MINHIYFGKPSDDQMTANGFPKYKWLLRLISDDRC
jgi:hypothetical protein